VRPVRRSSVLLRRILGGSDHLISADASVDDRDAIAIGGVETSGEDVRPAIVAIERERRCRR
jgi:hypothetical protein